MSLSSVKIKLKTILPAKLFLLILFIWNGLIKPLYFLIDRIRLLGFKTEEEVKLSLKGVEFKLLINPQNGFIDKYVYCHGIYEDYILLRILKYLPRSGTFLDIGANIGQHAMFTAAYLNNFGRVYAFEPVPSLFNQLNRSIQINQFTNIQSLDFACGNTNSIAQIFTNHDNAGQSSLVMRQNNQEVINIQVKRLDDWLPSDVKVDMIKIDVEGYEYEVLLGAEQIILKNKPVIIFEFSPVIYHDRDAGLSLKVLDFLIQYYYLTDIDEGDIIITNPRQYLATFNRKKRLQTNILCLPKYKNYV